MKNNEYSLALLCDFYELTMGRGYFDTDKRNTIAYFDVFFRRVPDGGGYAITAGLEQIVHYIENLSFTEADISVYDPGLGDTSTPIDGGKQFGLPSGGTVTYNDGNALFSLKANEDKPVVVRVWLEGTDPACNDSIRNADFKIWLRFIGTDENGNPLIDQRNDKHRTGN